MEVTEGSESDICKNAKKQDNHVDTELPANLKGDRNEIREGKKSSKTKGLFCFPL